MFSSTRRVTQERQVNKDLQEWQVKEWVLLMNEIVCGVWCAEIRGHLRKLEEKHVGDSQACQKHILEWQIHCVDQRRVHVHYVVFTACLYCFSVLFFNFLSFLNDWGHKLVQSYVAQLQEAELPDVW